MSMAIIRRIVGALVVLAGILPMATPSAFAAGPCGGPAIAELHDPGIKAVAAGEVIMVPAGGCTHYSTEQQVRDFWDSWVRDFTGPHPGAWTCALRVVCAPIDAAWAAARAPQSPPGDCSVDPAVGPAIVQYGDLMQGGRPTVQKVYPGQTAMKNLGGCFAFPNGKALDDRWPGHVNDFRSQYPNSLQVIDNPPAAPAAQAAPAAAPAQPQAAASPSAAPASLVLVTDDKNNPLWQATCGQGRGRSITQWGDASGAQMEVARAGKGGVPKVGLDGSGHCWAFPDDASLEYQWPRHRDNLQSQSPNPVNPTFATDPAPIS